MALLKNFQMQVHGANLDEIAKLNGCEKSEILDFSSNLNPLGPSKNAELAIVENIGNIADYPQDNDSLKAALSDYLSVDKNNLFIDNGSAAIIYKLFSLLNLKQVTILQPTFSEYENTTIVNGCEINKVSISHLQATSYKLQASCALFICNPNNPTAELIDRSFIEQLSKKADEKGAFVVIDEAFMDFVEDRGKYSVIDLVDELPNLIVLGSLTKFFSLAGLRIGYLCANKNIIEKMEKISPPWLINTLAAKASCASLLDSLYIETTKVQIPELRKDLVSRLRAVKSIKTYDSKINFVLAGLEKPLTSDILYEELAKRKVLIRDCSSFGMGTRFIRLAVKLPEQNKKLVEVMSEVINEIS